MMASAMILDLSGPSKAKRIATLDAFLLDTSFDKEVVDICLTIENVPPTITDYRDRERHLENLLKTLRNEGPMASEGTQVVAFRYLLGSLYVNFEKFWGPTVRVITSVLSQSRFHHKLLRTLLDHLKETSDIIYHEEHLNVPDPSQDRPDHVLHRNFLLQLLSKHPSFIESHNEEFMDQFFIFVHKEMLVSPFIEKFTRDDLRVSQQADNEDSRMDIDNEVSENTSNRKRNGKRTTKKLAIPANLLQKRKSRETFITATKIIQSFKSIDKTHRHEELQSLLMDLLCCRDSSVQKAAFNCILAYQHSYLQPYVERILKIINDKTARVGLTMLSLDSPESEQIQEAHRPKLVPIVLRILFGKMIGKIGRKTSGRDKADMRKQLVMRSIAGCTSSEILYFFELLFDPIFSHANISYHQLEETLEHNMDFTNYVPLNKLQAMLNSIMIHIDSVAHLQEESLPYVLKLINIITYYVVKPLEAKTLPLLSNKSLAALKILKRSCINALTQFFQNFEYYQYNQSEINFIFKNLVWASTDGFIDRNYAEPTPILKFIEVLSSTRIYHPLLIKRNKANLDEYLLIHILDLYANSKTQRPILKRIATILANILHPDRDLESMEQLDQEKIKIIPMLKDEDSVVPKFDKSSYKIESEIEFGVEILINFIPTIFERLKRGCQEFIDKKNAEYHIAEDELTVLSTLSNYLKDPDQCMLGARLLLSTLAHQKKGNLIIQTIQAAQALVRRTQSSIDPAIICLISDFLSFQRNTDQRRELCNFIECLAQIDENLSTVSKIICLMNSTSDESLSYRDFAVWNEGFSLALEYLDEIQESIKSQPELVKYPLMLLLHQIGFIVNNVDRYDFSIRENCLVFYEKLARKLQLVDASTNTNLLHEILDNILLEKFIKKGLRETNETIKHTHIGILRPLAIHCYEKSKTLKELHLLCSENSDLDFWLNIRHIQLHNRSKALSRLAASDRINLISPKTLSSYIMPIAAGFLFSRAYKSISSLADNSIKLIGMICRHLNWFTYESTLSYYLGLLTKANEIYQRTNIKLITEILKNFHFDITACQEAMETQEENNKLMQRMKRRVGRKDEPADSQLELGKKLNPSTAQLIYYSVTKKLIPRLNSCLNEMTRVEFENDKNMANYLPEKEEIKRIPIAYAIVQLLNLLPGKYVLFRDNLPTIFLKLSSFLKSKNEQVRKAARATLVKIMVFVGPIYVPDLLRILKQNLDKGFQVHVLNYTIHSVLNKLPLHYGALDMSVQELVDCCFQEIFGKSSEDKEVLQILAKYFEAKKTKSYDTLLIISSYISAEKLPYLVNSLKELLRTSNDSKKVNKLSVCLQKVFNGLAKNTGFPLDKLLVFIQSTIEESIPSLKVRQKVDSSEGSSKVQIPLRDDRYLITKDLPRDRVKSKINEKGNFHMMVENCLRLLLLTFDTNKSKIKGNESHQKRLDGFVNLLSTCLKSSSPKCVMRSLKCIHFIAQVKIDLPSFKFKCNSIVKRIFILLSLYNGVGMVHGDNFEMIGMCFKTLTLLLLRCEHVKLDDNQIRALMTYIEQDFHDTTRQATALRTLNSLVQRKCESPELAEIMTQLADLLVTSEDENVRALSIKIWQAYLLEYKHEGGMLQVHLTKFMRQLDYEFVDGRKSVLKILSIAVSKFPEKLLRDHYELMFHLLGQRVVNEESKEVRGLVGRLIGLIIQRLPDQQQHLFNKFVIPWASSSNIEIKLLGIKLISIFIEASSSMFTSDKGKIKKIVHILSEAIVIVEEKVGENVELEDEMNDENAEESIQETKLIKPIDKLNYHLLRTFKRLLDKELIRSTESRYIADLKIIWQKIASEKITYWYLPVVLTSCDLYLIFIKSNNLAKALDDPSPSVDNYLHWNAKRIVRTLCDQYIALLDRIDITKQLEAYIIDTMITLGQLAASSRASIEFENEYTNSFTGGNILEHMLSLKDLPNDGFDHQHLPHSLNEARKHVNLAWLSIKIVMQARKEAAIYRLKQTHRRDFVLKWSAAIMQELGPKRIAPYQVLLMMTPVRELSDKGKIKANDASSSQNTSLMAEDLLKFTKSLTNVDMFNKIYSRVQLHFTRRRVERKKKEAVFKVKEQLRGVKRKMKTNKDKTTKRKLMIK